MGGGQTSAGSSGEQNSSPCGVTAATLDHNFWTISTDQHCSPLHLKSTAIRRDQMILDEFVIFKLLECLLGSWVGSLQCWWSPSHFFLIYLSVTHLFSCNGAWVITPVPKVQWLATEADYRHISITVYYAAFYRSLWWGDVSTSSWLGHRVTGHSPFSVFSNPLLLLLPPSYT